MMLKVQSGSMLTGCGLVPGGAHHVLNSCPDPTSSSDTRNGASAKAPIAAAVSLFSAIRPSATMGPTSPPKPSSL